MRKATPQQAHQREAGAAFISPQDVARLTGFARKARQVAQLRRMGIAFFVNARGEPVIPAAALSSGPAAAGPAGMWSPTVAPRTAVAKHKPTAADPFPHPRKAR